MIVIMSVTQWYTMAQLSMKNMSADSLNSDNPMIRSQRMMMYVMPVIFAVSGVNFQIGVLVYWVVSNLWTMGQQFFTIRNMPAPGSEAEKKYRARINAKRARKGLPSLEEEERAEAIVLGCGGMAGLDRELSELLGVPVVEGVAAGAMLAEGLVRLGLTTSKIRTYAPPRPKSLTGWPLRP